MANFKDMIRFLADYKMNTLIFYFEDTFRFKKYPTIGEGRGASRAKRSTSSRRSHGHWGWSCCRFSKCSVIKARC